MKRINFPTWAIIIAVTSWNEIAVAHPGHGVESSTALVHHILSPAHLPMTVCFLVIAAIVVTFFSMRCTSRMGDA